MKILIKNLIVSAGLLLLMSCGGGSDSAPAPKSTPNPSTQVNQPPTVSVESPAAVFEHEPVSLLATASDSDGTIAYYEWSQISGETVLSMQTNGAEAAFISPAVSVASVVEFELKVTDDKGATVAKVVAITVKPKSMAVSVNAGDDRTLYKETSAVLSGKLEDTQSFVFRTEWKNAADQNLQINSPGTLSTEVMIPAGFPGKVFEFELIAYGAGDTVIASDKILVKVSSGVTIDVGSDIEVKPGSTVSLAAQLSDPDKLVNRFEWKQLEGDSVKFDDINTLTPQVTLPQKITSKVFKFELTAYSIAGSVIASDSIVVSVIQPAINILPVVSAGKLPEIFSGETVTFNGSASDSDGEIIQYKWSQINANNAVPVNIVNADSLAASFFAPDTKVDINLQFQLEVTDNDGGKAKSEVTVLLKPKVVPVETSADAGESKIVVAGEMIELVGSGTAQGKIINYQWSSAKTNPVNVDLINPGNKVARFTAPEIKNITELEFILEVTDDQQKKAQARMTVTVHPALVVNAGADKNIASGGDVILAGKSNASGTNITYKWSLISTGHDIRLDNINSEQLSFKAPVHEYGKENELTLKFKLEVSEDISGKKYTNHDLLSVVVNPVIKACNALIIKGKVIASERVLSSPGVIINIGGHKEEVSANNRGEYAATVNCNRVRNVSHRIHIRAVGRLNNIKLMSIGPQFKDAVRMAGDDSILDSKEFVGTNISYLTTAMAAMSYDKTNNRFFELNYELTRFISNFSFPVVTEKLLKTAAAIKLSAMLYDKTGHWMNGCPSARDSIVWATESTRVDCVIQQNEKKKPGTYIEQKNLIIQQLDSHAVNPVVPDFYLGKIEHALLGGFHMSFDKSTRQQYGAGLLTIKGVKKTFNWVNDNGLKITLDDAAGNVIYSDSEKFGTDEKLIRRNLVLDSILIKIVATHGGAEFVNLTTRYSYAYPGGEKPDSQIYSFTSHTFLYNDYIKMTEADVIGYRALPLHAKIRNADNQSNLTSGMFSFTADKKVVYHRVARSEDLDINSGTWTLKSDGTLTMEFNSPHSPEIYQFEVRRINNRYFSVLLKKVLENSSKLSLGISELRKEKSLWAGQQIRGVYHYQVDEERSGMKVSLELSKDNNGGFTGKHTTEYMANNQKIVESVTHWEVIDGKLVVISELDASVPSVPGSLSVAREVATPNVIPGIPEVTPPTPSKVNIKRLFDLVKTDDGRHYMIEYYQVKSDIIGEFQTARVSIGVWTK